MNTCWPNVRSPRYGELEAERNAEAVAIWRSRQQELPPCECEEWRMGESEVDQVRFEEIEMGGRLWKLAKRILPERHMAVIYKKTVLGSTYVELAAELNVSLERVRQIHQEALRRIRKAVGRDQVSFCAPYWVRSVPAASHPGYAWDECVSEVAAC